MKFYSTGRFWLALICCGSLIAFTFIAATQHSSRSQNAYRSTADSLIPVLPPTLLDYTFPLPAYLRTPNLNAADNTPANNPVTDAGATLGRVLFFDKKLSQNYTLSCGSCHLGSFGFSDSAAFSEGFQGGRTGRNSMGLANARFYGPGRFFWDERAATLEDQVLMPIQDHIEMGLTLDTLVARVSNSSYYPALFTAAFGDPTVDELRISRALAQFVRSMVSTTSKFDVGRAQTFPAPPADPFPNYTAQENLGKSIFFNRGNCAACHGTDAFVAPGPRNNGLELAVVDSGVYLSSGLPGDIAKFKAHSLKNIAQNGPYMHDGRFATLEQVVEHYNSGVQPHPNLDPALRNPPPNNQQPRRLNLNNGEKAALVAFLHTLTDSAMLVDERWADPFQPTGNPTSLSLPIPLEETRVYPNPFSEVLNIKLPDLQGKQARLRLFTLGGKRLMDIETNQQEVQISRHDLTTGLYWLDITVGNSRTGKKVIVK